MSTSSAIRALQPTKLWNAFADLNAVPRGSKKEEKVSQFVEARGRALGLETHRDHVGNVLIKKPASRGYENHPTVVLQAHIDMVWQKNSDSSFDFETMGIAMELDGDWVKALGTTLGADNGIGVATMFSVLESNDVQHPPLECLFTIDEETGMTGAKELSSSWCDGRVLLNLDTEQDNELTIGCAGGADVTANGTYTEEAAPRGLSMQIAVRGLKGGHSGMEIHLGRGNANKIMNRLLIGAQAFGVRIASIDGGGLRNAIPRESTSMIIVPQDQADAFAMWIMKEALTVRMENSVTDPNLQITCTPSTETIERVMNLEAQRLLLATIAGTVSGIYRMSPSIAGLVQSSNNLARVIVQKGQCTLMCLARSSVDSERVELTQSLKAILSLVGKVEIAGEYPGWQPLPSSKIVQTMRTIYHEMFGEEPHVAACHAGLECGIIGGKFPGMEMVSFGPNILGAHSPDERVQVSSVQKFYGYFLKVLASL